MDIFIPNNQDSNWKNFDANYDIKEVLLATGHRNYELKKKAGRICRFCGKDAKQTTFRRIAHIIPQALGNKNFISDFECDACNEKFSDYEQHLCNYFGIQRTLHNVRGKKGIPNYRSGGEKIITSRVLGRGFKIIQRENIGDESFEFNKEKKQFIIDTSKPGYVPIYIFKSLLRIGLSLVGDEILKYQLAIKYLDKNDFYKSFHGLNNIFIQQTDLGYNFPSAILFQKKNSQVKLPTHILGFYCLGFFMQIILPLHRDDNFLFRANGTQTLFSPPIIFSPTSLPFNVLNADHKDFSSDKMILENEKMVFSMEELPNARYNPATKQIEKIIW